MCYFSNAALKVISPDLTPQDMNITRFTIGDFDVS